MRHSNNKSVFIADLLMMLRALEKDRVPVIVAVSLFSYLEYMAVKTSDSRLSTSTHEFGRGAHLCYCPSFTSKGLVCPFVAAAVLTLF